VWILLAFAGNNAALTLALFGGNTTAIRPPGMLGLLIRMLNEIKPIGCC